MRTGDRGRGRPGEPLPTFEPGNDIVAGLTVLAEGTQGYLTGAAVDQFGLHGENPQIWALGVKEVWRVRKPLRRIIHTMGWPLRTSASFGEFGGSFIYPMGDDLVTVGFVAGLEAADVEFSVHDVLQEFKTHRLVWKILGGGERVAWGAKTITEGGYYSLPRGSTRPGCCSWARARGSSTCPASRASTTRSSRVGSPPRRRSARSSAARCRAASARSTPTTSRCARAHT